MNRLTRRTIIAAILAALAWLAGPGTRLAPRDAAGQEPAKPGSSAPSRAPCGPIQRPGQPDDDEETALRDALAHKSLQENCLICHTEDMITGQRLTSAQWKAEVDKMVGWGAPLPTEAAAPLTDYLARHYSDRSPPPVPRRATIAEVGSLEVAAGTDPGQVPVKGNLSHGGQLYAANCATCHGPAALGGDLGPSLVNRPILHHVAEYDRIMRQGLRRMPGFQPILKGNDEADLRAWLLSRSYPE